MNKPRMYSARQTGGKLPSTVFLVGFMGAGKTAVGRSLAALLDWRFVDLDCCIETREKRDIAQIFGESGEEEFRRIESSVLSELLEELADDPRAVVALGGGAFVSKENVRALKQSGAFTVFLDASIEELRRRCAPISGRRPLFRDENQFRQLYEMRKSSYMQADFRVDTAGKSIDAIAQEVGTLISLVGSNET